MTAAAPIRDEHSVLLWQTCAYADEVSDAALSRRRLTPVHDEMLQFLHYRLLPYLTNEERQLAPGCLRDEHMLRLLRADHERLRADVENVESSRTRRLLALAASVLVDRLDRHMRREECWLAVPLGAPRVPDVQDWALPLLFSEVIDLDALPADDREDMVRRRLAWLHPGESVRLQARHDLHRLWQRQHASHRNAYAWLYEQDGPSRWQVRVTRRADPDC
jgi:uncharacterized protein (DUF2249 family)